ncbi:CubicO group peptidase, beta-lactamase class C family [Microbispora rosea]|uniref:CubicO group peptidase, beta-lactamase class C family n=2 Tax=Microbispora rosea TaxID=58117 RepID=A0A1N7CTE4_9ACTN|nr:serine hydrolase [Microbispora rosea subsp. rosea]SIR66918.1 CubicO group peptidase, beta-lactamase class C family [Microbispora rosea]
MRMRKIAATAGLAGVLLLATGTAAVDAATRAATTDGRTGLTAESVDRYVRDYIRRTDLPGAVVTVVKGDKVVYAAGHGHTAGGEAITADTPMPLASLSKSFTALAVLRLADEGRIDLDAPVRRYLPEFTMADPRAEKITVRQLLQQTSGMSDRTFPELTLPAPDDLKDAVAMLRTAPLAAAPGTRMIYHNPNYAVAARLAEVVSGTPFAEFMAATVFTPLGMTSTRTVDTTEELPGAGAGYIRAYGQVIERAHPKWFVNGSYGVVSTAHDLARWLITQNGHGGALPRELVRATQTPSGVGGSTYGMGWSAERTAGGAPMLRHTGWLLTHNSAQTLLPGGEWGIAVVTNTGMISGDDALIISDGLVDMIEGRPDAKAAPFTTSADPWLAGLSLLNLGLGLTGVLRSRRWAARRAQGRTWRMIARLVPYALPVAFYLGLAELAGVLLNRVGTLDQLTYVWLALYVWAATGALAAVAVVAARLVHAVRLRRQAVGNVPVSETRQSASTA